MSCRQNHSISGWALATVSILFLFSAAVSSCGNRDESPIWLYAQPGNLDRDTLRVSPDKTGHVLYLVDSWTSTGASLTSISLTEMSDENGLRAVETRNVNAPKVHEIFDYETSVTSKDTSSFTMIFHAEDNAGNTQDFHRRLTIVKVK